MQQHLQQIDGHYDPYNNQTTTTGGGAQQCAPAPNAACSMMSWQHSACCDSALLAGPFAEQLASIDHKRTQYDGRRSINEPLVHVT